MRPSGRAGSLLSVAATLILVVGAAALSMTWPSRTPAPRVAGGPLVTYSSEGVTFQFPESWQARDFNGIGGSPPVIVYVSTQTIHEPCDLSTSAAGARAECSWAVGDLAPDGVLVEWTQGVFTFPSLPSQPGARIVLGGRPARLQDADPGACGALGSTETIFAYTVDRHYAFLACLRGPDLTSLRTQVLAMLRSTRIGLPRNL